MAKINEFQYVRKDGQVRFAPRRAPIRSVRIYSNGDIEASIDKVTSLNDKLELDYEVINSNNKSPSQESEDDI